MTARLALTALSSTCLTLACLAAGCSTYKESGGDLAAARQRLEQDAGFAIAAFKSKDPSMSRFFNSGHAYAVFPKVSKGAVGIGGAHGDGVVYQSGTVIGYATLNQGTVGLQLGGQVYREIIFFETPRQLDVFKSSKLVFAGQASAVAAAKGASGSVDYSEGVAVFTMTTGGLMFEASIGGQEFTYSPKK